MGAGILNSLKSIFRKKVRALLTILGIAIGVMSVIIIGFISSSGTVAVSSEMDSLGLSGLTISIKDGSSASLTDTELNELKSFNEVKKAVPLMLLTTEINSNAEKEKAFVWGIDSNAKDVVSLNLLYGRYINKADINSRAKVCMVDQSFAKTVYKRDNIVGKSISFQCGNSFDKYEIVGVIKTGSGLLQNMMGSYIPNFIYAPYKTIQEGIGTNSYHQIITKVNAGTDTDQLSKKIENKLNKLNGKEDSYSVTNLAQQKEILTNIISIITIILSAVGAVALVVAGMSIMTVMLVAVSERTKEIGIKKSIGATKKAIVLEFISEALLLSLLGCIVGIILGIAISYIGANIFGLNFSVDYYSIAIASLVSIVLGVSFGVYPASIAANMKPVDALRTE